MTKITALDAYNWSMRTLGHWEAMKTCHMKMTHTSLLMLLCLHLQLAYTTKEWYEFYLKIPSPFACFFFFFFHFAHSLLFTHLRSPVLLKMLQWNVSSELTRRERRIKTRNKLQLYEKRVRKWWNMLQELANMCIVDDYLSVLVCVLSLTRCRFIWWGVNIRVKKVTVMMKQPV